VEIARLFVLGGDGRQGQGIRGGLEERAYLGGLEETGVPFQQGRREARFAQRPGEREIGGHHRERREDQRGDQAPGERPRHEPRQPIEAARDGVPPHRAEERVERTLDRQSGDHLTGERQHPEGDDGRRAGTEAGEPIEERDQRQVAEQHQRHHDRRRHEAARRAQPADAEADERGEGHEGDDQQIDRLRTHATP